MRRTLDQDRESLERRQVASCGYVVETLPLHDAVRARHPECVRFLLESGANPDAYDAGTKYTPLGFAILLTHSDCPEDIVRLLLQNGASTNLDHGNYYGRTAYLEDSITKRWPRVMEMLLEHGCDLEDMIINEKGEKQLRKTTDPPIIEAIWRQKTEILKLLLLRGASLSFNDCRGNKISIPHKILNFYKSADRALEALRVYREFGGDVLTKKNHLQNSVEYQYRTVFDSLQAKPDKYGFKDSTQEFIQELEEIISTPLSLQSQCRLTIKHVMGSEYWRKVSLLPLPEDVKKFLLFMELVITEIEDADDDYM